MDWVRFLDENNIHYVTRGPNTKRGEVSIQCPMCGVDDPSEHLGINLSTGKWGCHRDSNHRGRSSYTLVKAILQCSGYEAQSVVKQYCVADPDTLEAALLSLTEQAEPLKSIPKVPLEPEFQAFNHIKMHGATRRFYQYLHARHPDPIALIKRYDLRCALTGRYQDRIIIPVRHNATLLGWTARAIVNPKNAPRYLMASTDVKSTIFDYDNVKKGGAVLFITEGPFDAMRMSSGDVRSTCTFGTSVSMPQICLLRAVAKKYEKVWVLFDQDAPGASQELASWIGAESAFLPPGYKDPGELSQKLVNHALSEDFIGCWWT